MQLLRTARWFLLALLISIVPASSYAGVFISVGFAPPVLPVYEQPPCPEPGLMWTPGYWAYGDDGYYWVPGAWVPVPYEGALWTPPYWGWDTGLYVYHPGYWGTHVGYYGGVNYGFGYMGVGFVGGAWRGHEFAYNTAVVRVNRTVIRNVYEDRTVVERNTIVNDRRVAFAGGPGGIRHDPSPEERMAMRESHVAPTSFQQQHMQSARMDHASYFKANNGRPQNLVMARPLPAEHHAAPAPGAMNQGRPGEGFNGGNAGRPANNAQPQNRPAFQQPNRPAPASQPQERPAPGGRPDYQSRPAQGNQPQARPEQQSRPAQTTRPEQENRPAPSARPEQQSRPEQRYQAQPQPRPEQQSRPAQGPRPEQQSRPEQRYQAQPQPRPEQQSRPAQGPRPEQQSRPAQGPRPEQQSRPAPQHSEPKQHEPHH